MGVTSFKGIDNIGDECIDEIVRDNLVSYFDWCMLEAGGFFNITIPTSGAFGGNREKLRRVEDPRFTSGTVWEGQRKNWIWEDSLARSQQPISISGIYINNTFWPENSGYYIDYPNGRVVFNSPMPAASSVKIEHSYKWVYIASSDGLEDISTIQYRSFRADDNNIPVNSGAWTRLADTRVQLPALLINIPTRKTYAGYQLGGSQWARMDVLCDVIGEDKSSVKKVANAISSQNESTIFVYDTNKLADDDKMPLDYRGSPRDNAMTYPELIAPTGNGGYRYINKIQHGQMTLINAEEQGCQRVNNNLWHCPVTLTIELVINDI